jgi:dTDP-4-dehydrorhamnose reductase
VIRRQRLMMITGATGFLGRHLVEASEIGGWQLLAPSSISLDVRQRARVLDEITTWKPNVVVHLAYRRDDRRCIVDGSEAVAVAACRVGARLIHVSTDMVFAGRSTPYVETDRTDARLPYGRWKAEAETLVQRACPSALIVRPSLLYGTDVLGACQHDVLAALSGSPTMKFFTDESRCPAHAADVAAAICVLADRHDISGPLHLAGPQALTRAQFAVAIARYLGLDERGLQFTSLAEAGLDRPGVLILSTARAQSLGLSIRSVAEALR